MDVKLKVMGGAYAGKLISVTGPKFLIGRAQDCHLRAASDLISRHHCAVLISDTDVKIRDFGSRNGTLVNGEPIDGERELKAGDRLKVGPLEFEVVSEHRVGGKKRPAIKDISDVAARTAARSKSSNVEEEITSWLGEPEVRHTSRWVAETETQAIHVSQNDDTVTDAKGKEGASDKDKGKDAKGKPEKREPGKLPPNVGPQPKDSREAAANILKHLTKRR